MSPDKDMKILNDSEDVANPVAVDTANASDEKQQKSDSETSDEEKTFRKQCEKLGDPMAEDFQHPAVNSYKFNNFDVEQEPGYLNRVKALGIPAGTRVYSLNIKHIHQGFNQRGIENIFRPFGEIIECRLARLRHDAPSTEKTWGTVKFATKMEAAQAIAALNGKPPFNFSVTWSKSKDLKERQKKEAIREKLYSAKFTELMKEDEKAKAAEFEWPKVADTYEKINNELLKKLKDEAKNGSDEGSENSDSDYKTRKRGDKNICQVYEFNPSVDTLPKEFGRPLYTSTSVSSSCSSCSLPGRMTCSRCSAWYCSLACQEAHWPNHQNKCTINKHQLERRLSELSLEEIENEDGENKSEQEFERQVGYEDKKINGVEQSKDQLKAAPTQTKDQHKASPTQTKDEHKAAPTQSKLGRTEKKNDSGAAVTRLEDPNDNVTNSRVKEEEKPESSPSPSIGETFHGTVSHVVYPHELYILPDTSKDLYDSVLVDIQDDPLGAVTLQPGELCSASYQGIWFRSTILKLLPSGNVQVLLIDLGMTTEVEKTDVKPLVKYREHGGLVVKIKLCGIEPCSGGWGEDTIDQFREIVDECGDTKFKVTVVEKNSSGDLIAKLEDGDGNDVGQLCTEYGLAIQAQSNKNTETEKAMLNPTTEEGEPEIEILNVTNKKVSDPSVVLSPVKPAKLESKLPPCAQSLLSTLAKGDKIQIAKDQRAPFSQFGAQICKGVLEEDEDGDYLYDDLQEEAQDYRLNGSYTSQSLQLKSWVVAWSQDDEFFFRGVVIDVSLSEDKFTVFLLDFGYIQTFRAGDLMDMWPRARRCPARAVHVVSGCVKGKRIKLEDSLKERGQAFFKDKEEDSGKYVEGGVVAVRSEGVYLSFPGLQVIFLATSWYNCNGKTKALFNSLLSK